MMQDGLKRGSTKFTAESVRGSLRVPFSARFELLTYAAAAKALTKQGDKASPSLVSSPLSSLLVTLALEESFLAPPAP